MTINKIDENIWDMGEKSKQNLPPRQSPRNILSTIQIIVAIGAVFTTIVTAWVNLNSTVEHLNEKFILFQQNINDDIDEIKSNIKRIEIKIRNQRIEIRKLRDKYETKKQD